MPMSNDFKERLNQILPQIVKHYGTPFHVYDEVGITENAQDLYSQFSEGSGFRNYFAVKALPNPRIISLLLSLEMGFDCSSIPELVIARSVGAKPDQIIFTSNNTDAPEYEAALADGGCILNLDDLTFVEKVPEPFPEQICFRFNPGKKRSGSRFIGDPSDAKYGLREDQLITAYRLARDRGAKRFGLHTMIISNELDYKFMLTTVHMLLEIIEDLERKTGIIFEFINIGGGIGIPYKPDDHGFHITSLGHYTQLILKEFLTKNGYAPTLYSECGRYVTGPHGVLVTTCINRMIKHKEYVGVDASMSALMRPGMYGAYHHINIVDPNGQEKDGVTEVVDVVGSLCENNDKFAVDRELPKVVGGDFVIIHDTGAHGHAMGFNYNGRLRPKELLLRSDGKVELIRRAETHEDYTATLRFEPDVLDLTA
ncbi:MAG: diaminopimelate decarboxylase [Candidatus Woykebacteria bacterium]